MKNIRKKLEKHLEDKSPCCFCEHAKNKIGNFVQVLSQCIRFLRLFGGQTSQYEENEATTIEEEAKVIFESDGMEFDMKDYEENKNVGENMYGYRFRFSSYYLCKKDDSNDLENANLSTFKKLVELDLKFEEPSMGLIYWAVYFLSEMKNAKTELLDVS